MARILLLYNVKNLLTHLQEPGTLQHMKRYKEIQTISSRVVETKCDICGKIAPWPDGWEKGPHDVAEVTLELREGRSYPDGGSGKKYFVDMCPECFKTKLIPWLSSLGCTLQVKDRDY